MVSPTLGREVIRRRRSCDATDASDVLRQIGAGLRDDATMALCCGAGVVQTRFTLTVADARALADEIARLQGLEDAPVPKGVAYTKVGPDIPMMAFGLAGILTLAMPVALSILGWLQ